MAEPRARPRTKGQLFSTPDLTDLLYAYSTTTPALPSTINCLDEILTDFIIETCHTAALSASYSRRQKIKIDDFKFVLRKDEVLLGRVMEQLWREKKLKEERKVVDLETMGKEVAEDEQVVDAEGAIGGRRKRRRKRREREDDVVTDGGPQAKRVAS